MTINRIILLDAATCAIMGVVLVAASAVLSTLLGLPENLLYYAGLVLLPIAAFMAIVARQSTPPSAGVWLIVIGNIAWVIASIAVLTIFSPNGLGSAFVLLQAAVVSIFALAEYTNRPRLAVRGA